MFFSGQRSVRSGKPWAGRRLRGRESLSPLDRWHFLCRRSGASRTHTNGSTYTQYGGELVGKHPEAEIFRVHQDTRLLHHVQKLESRNRDREAQRVIAGAMASESPGREEHSGDSFTTRHYHASPSAACELGIWHSTEKILSSFFPDKRSKSRKSSCKQGESAPRANKGIVCPGFSLRLGSPGCPVTVAEKKHLQREGCRKWSDKSLPWVWTYQAPPQIVQMAFCW